MLNLDSSIALITVAYTLRLIGVGMIMMPLTTAGINSLPPHLIPHGTAMNNTMRQMGGSIGTAVLVSIMSVLAANAKIIRSNEVSRSWYEYVIYRVWCYCGHWTRSLVLLKRKT